ncbi:hypothetical protein [Streptomyces tibetensis]|uniref:hypothetical protein n=1 Tax=Streptomyces tibetensis TaxID=2382123 RepID=UPI0033F4BC1A
MGERPSDDGLSGRGSRHALLDSGVEALIVASLVRDGVDAEAEQRAVAAFRAARDARSPRTRTRRRDDWRPRERRHLGRSLKTTLSVLLASLTLGGVAVAAIGVAGSPREDTNDAPGRRPAPSSTPRDPAGQPPGGSHSPGTGSGPAHSKRPTPAQDTEAHCRAYQKVRQRGQVMEASAWRRLVAAAGGENNITAYCAEQATRSDAHPGRTARPEQGTGASGNSGNGNGTANGNGTTNGPGSANSGAKADNGSGKTDNGSGKADNGSGKADNGSGKADNNSDGAVSGSGAGGGNSAAGDDGSAAGSGDGETRTDGQPARPDDSRP